MEYIKGIDLISYLKENPDKADRVFERTVDGFVHLGKSSIIHRDIRPANILVDETGEPKIIDFGFGKDLGLVKKMTGRASL